MGYGLPEWLATNNTIRVLVPDSVHNVLLHATTKRKSATVLELYSV